MSWVTTCKVMKSLEVEKVDWKSWKNSNYFLLQNDGHQNMEQKVFGSNFFLRKYFLLNPKAKNAHWPQLSNAPNYSFNGPKLQKLSPKNCRSYFGLFQIVSDTKSPNPSAKEINCYIIPWVSSKNYNRNSDLAFRGVVGLVWDVEGLQTPPARSF